MTKYFINDNGEYLGGFDCGDDFVLDGGFEVSEPPEHAADTWNGEKWVRNIEQRNAAIKAQRIAAFADLLTGSDGMFIKAMATGEAKDLLAATERRQAIIDSLPYEVE